MMPSEETITLDISLENAVKLTLTLKSDALLLETLIKRHKTDYENLKSDCHPDDLTNTERLKRTKNHLDRLDVILKDKKDFFYLIRTQLIAQGFDVEKELNETSDENAN